jgi:hypothetical protein
MNISLSDHRPRAQQITIIAGLLLLISAFFSFSQQELREGMIVVIAMTVIFGRTAANSTTAGLAVVLAAIFLISGLLRNHDYVLGDFLFYVATGLSMCLGLAYLMLYLRAKVRGPKM